jgi:hypothetical protein
VAGTCDCGNAGNSLNRCKPVSFSRMTLLLGVSKYMGKVRSLNVVNVNDIQYHAFNQIVWTPTNSKLEQ